MSLSFGQLMPLLIALPVIPIIGLIRAKRHRWAWWIGLGVAVALPVGLSGYVLYVQSILSTLPS